MAAIGVSGQVELKSSYDESSRCLLMHIGRLRVTTASGPLQALIKVELLRGSASVAMQRTRTVQTDDPASLNQEMAFSLTKFDRDCLLRLSLSVGAKVSADSGVCMTFAARDLLPPSAASGWYSFLPMTTGQSKFELAAELNIAMPDPVVLTVVGRVGPNSAINGTYTLVPERFVNKPSYVSQDGKLFIYCHPQQPAWLIGKRIGDVVAPAFVHSAAQQPHLITEVWNVAAGSKFELDPNVRVIDSESEPAVDDEPAEPLPPPPPSPPPTDDHDAVDGHRLDARSQPAGRILDVQHAIQREESYNDDLALFVNTFNWETTMLPDLTRNDYELIVRNLHRLLEANLRFIEDLRARNFPTAGDDIIIGDVFRDYIAKAAPMVLEFAQQGALCRVILRELSERPFVSALLASLSATCHGRDVEDDLLLLPITNLSTLQATFTKLITVTPATHTDFHLLREAQRILTDTVAALPERIALGETTASLLCAIDVPASNPMFNGVQIEHIVAAGRVVHISGDFELVAPPSGSSGQTTIVTLMLCNDAVIMSRLDTSELVYTPAHWHDVALDDSNQTDLAFTIGTMEFVLKPLEESPSYWQQQFQRVNALESHGKSIRKRTITPKDVHAGRPKLPSSGSSSGLIPPANPPPAMPPQRPKLVEQAKPGSPSVAKKPALAVKPVVPAATGATTIDASSYTLQIPSDLSTLKTFLPSIVPYITKSNERVGSVDTQSVKQITALLTDPLQNVEPLNKQLRAVFDAFTMRFKASRTDGGFRDKQGVVSDIQTLEQRKTQLLKELQEIEVKLSELATSQERIEFNDSMMAAQQEWTAYVVALKEAERKAKEEAERKAREEAERLEAERLAKLEAERLAKEEAAHKAKEEADRLEAERLEAERLARLEAERRAREEADRKAKEEADRRARLEAERRALEEAERKEAERLARLEADRLAKADAERRLKEEARLEAERVARFEAERKEAERLAKVEVDRKAKEEADRKAKEAADRRAKEEADRKAQEEADRKAQEDARLETERIAAQAESQRKIDEAEAAAAAAAVVATAATTTTAASDKTADGALRRSGSKRAAEKQAVAAAAVGTKLRALFAYESASDGFKLAVGEIVELVVKVDANWYKVSKSVGGQSVVGLAPINYLGLKDPLPSPNQRAKGKYAYNSGKPNGLIFAVGDEMEILSVADANWFKVRKVSGGPNSEGLAPANYLQVINHDKEATQIALPAIDETSSHSGRNHSSDALTMQAPNTTLTTPTATVPARRPVPSSPSTAVSTSSLAPMSSRGSTASLSLPASDAVLYSGKYKYAAADGSFSFAVGDTLQLLAKVDQNWWRMKKLSGDMAEGLAPANYLKAAHTDATGTPGSSSSGSAPSTPSQIAKQASTANLTPKAIIIGGFVRGLHAYSATSPSAFAFVKGEVLEVIAMVDKNWMKVRKLARNGGGEGLAPVNYVASTEAPIGEEA